MQTVPPKEKLLSFSIGNFLTYYDVTNRKLQYILTHSIVQKQTLWERNIPMEITPSLSQIVLHILWTAPLFFINLKVVNQLSVQQTMGTGRANNIK